MKKFLALLLSMLMLLSVFPVGVLADEAAPEAEEIVTEETEPEATAEPVEAVPELTASESEPEPAQETNAVTESEPAETEPEVTETEPVETVPEVTATEEEPETAPEVTETEPAQETPEVTETEPVEEEPEVTTEPAETEPEVTESEPEPETAPEVTATEEEPATAPEVTETEPVEEEPEVTTEPAETEPEVTESEPEPETAPEVTATEEEPATAPEVTETEPVEEEPEVTTEPAEPAPEVTAEPSEEEKGLELVSEEALVEEAPMMMPMMLLGMGSPAYTSTEGITDEAGLEEAVNEGITTINVDSDVKIGSSWTIPSGVTVNVLSGGHLIVSASGAKLTLNGKLNVNNGGQLTVNGSLGGSSVPVLQSENASISPTTVRHMVKTVTPSKVTLTAGVESTDNQGKKIYIAATGVAFPFSVEVEPDNAYYTGISYSVTSGTVKTSGSKMTLDTAGEQTVTATAGSVSGTAKVTVSKYELELTDNNENSGEMFGNSTLTITAKIKPANLSETTLKDPEITAGADYATVSMSGSGDTYEILLTAKDVTEKQTVTISVESEDGKLSATKSVDVYPIAAQILLYKDSATDKDVAGSTIVYNIDDTSLTSMTFTGKVLPSGAKDEITFEYTDTNKCANVTITDNGTKNAKAVVTKSGNGNSGIVTLTATGRNGVSSNVDIQLMKVKTSVEITLPSNLKYIPVRSGSSATLSATATGADDGTVKWTLVNSSDAAYVTLDEKTGVIKAVDALADTKEVKVKATLYIENSAAASDTASVGVIPASTGVTISYGGETFKNGDTVLFNLGEFNAITLKGVVKPDGLSPVNSQNVKINCDWTSSNTAIATIDEDGTITPVAGEDGQYAEGTVTITCTAADGTGAKAYVKVKVDRQVHKITIKAEGGATSLVSGKSLQMNTTVLPAEAGTKVSYKIVNCDSSFNELTDSDDVFATVSSSGKVVAKTVYSDHYVKVVATATDGTNESASYNLTLKPAKAGALLILDNSGNDITTLTRTIDRGTGATTFQLKVPSSESVSWKTSNKSIATVSASGKVTIGSKLGTVTITATDNFDVKRKATVKITVISLVQKNQVTVATKNGVPAEITAGKKLALTYKVTGSATNKKIKWSLSSTAYATISSSGTVTAKKTLTEKTTVTAYATPVSGVKGSAASIKITLYPRASSVSLSGKIEGVTTAMNGNKYRMDIGSTSSIQLTAKVAPSDASQAVTWKSSSTKLATVSTTGLVTFNSNMKTGTVKITATAKDGSGKKATTTFTLYVGVKTLGVDKTKMNIVNYSGNDYIAVSGGKSITLKPIFNPTKATNKKVTWSIEDAESKLHASITTSGKLTARDVTDNHIIEVTVKSTTEDVKHVEKILVTPTVKSVVIKLSGTNVSGKNITRALGLGTIQLNASITPSAAAQGVTWKSSSTKIATVSASGKVTFNKAGKVTFTATSTDGSKKAAKVTVIITKD